MLSSFCSLDTTANFKAKVANGRHNAPLIAQANKAAVHLPVTLQTAVLD